MFAPNKSLVSLGAVFALFSMLTGCNLFGSPSQITSFTTGSASVPALSSVTFIAAFNQGTRELECRFDAHGDGEPEFIIPNCSSPVTLEYAYDQPGRYQPRFSLEGQGPPASIDLEVTEAEVSVGQVATAVADSYSLDGNSTLAIDAPGLISNDIATSGYLAQIVTKPQNANSFSLFSSGAFVYKPKKGFVGSDGFSYRLKKQHTYSNTVTVSLIVHDPGINDPPINTLPTAMSTLEETPLAIRASVADSDLASGDMQVQLNVSSGLLTLLSTSGLSFTVGDGIADPSLNFTGKLSAVNAALTQLRYLPPISFAGSATLTLSTNDQGNSGTGGPRSDSDSAHITISRTAAVPANDTYVVQTNLSLSLSPPGVLNNDSRLGNSSAAEVVNNPTRGSLTFRSNGSFKYTPNIGFVGSDSFTYRIKKGDLRSSVATVTLIVQDPLANNPPIITLPTAAVSTIEDIPVNISGISIADDSGSNPIKVTLGVNNGTLSLSTTTGLTFGAGKENGKELVELTGALSSVNTALASLSYASTQDWNGSDTFTITVDDQGNTGNGGAKSATQSRSIVVGAINDSPTIALPTTVLSVDEDNTLNVTGLSLNDVDASNSLLKVSLEVTNGKLNLTTTTGLTFDTSLANNTSKVQFTGNLTDLNAALGSFQYTPGANFNGNESLNVDVDDQGNFGSGGARTTSSTKLLTVSAVNDAPTITLPSATLSTDEDTTLTVSNLSLSDVDASSSTMKVSLGVSSGKLTLGSTSGLTFLTGKENGKATVEFTATLANINSALASLSYSPNSDWNGSDSFAITVDDQGNTGSGGAKSASGSKAVTVAPINDAPTISLFSMDRKLLAGSLEATFSWTISDIDSNSLTCALDVDNNGTADYTLANCDSEDTQVHSYSSAITTQAKLSVSDQSDGKVTASAQVIYVLSSITAGYQHTCSTNSTQVAFCWGNGSAGQLGNGSSLQQSSPVSINMPTGTHMTQVTTGAFHSCSVSSVGNAYCWGSNSYGQLGIGSFSSRFNPQVVNTPSGVFLTQISAGNAHTCALDNLGSIYCWGEGKWGQVGDSTLITRTTPVLVTLPGGLTALSISAGGWHTCAVASDQNAYCWGFNEYGQVGSGTSSTEAMPVKVAMPNSESVIQVEPGNVHTCALTSNGKAYCWGANKYGQLGNGSTTSQVTPTGVSMPTGVNFTHIEAGGEHNDLQGYTCALGSNQKAYCWGFGVYGQLGNGSNSSQSVPTEVTLPAGTAFTQISVSHGRYHTCAVGDDDGFYCWGFNNYGQLGIGNTSNQASPQKVIFP